MIEKQSDKLIENDNIDEKVDIHSKLVATEIERVDGNQSIESNSAKPEYGAQSAQLLFAPKKNVQGFVNLCEDLRESSQIMIIALLALMIVL